VLSLHGSVFRSEAGSMCHSPTKMIVITYLMEDRESHSHQHSTIKIWPNRTGIRSHPLRDGAHDHDLDFQDRSRQRGPQPRSPGSRPSAPQPTKATDELGAVTCSHTNATTPPRERVEDDDEGHGKLTLHRTVRTTTVPTTPS
jgi:hypothetical protein